MKELFTFGDWTNPKEFTRFCGRYEKQEDDGTIVVQMDDSAKKLQDPPSRKAGSKQPLLPNEKKWIGTITGQLN